MEINSRQKTSGEQVVWLPSRLSRETQLSTQNRQRRNITENGLLKKRLERPTMMNQTARKRREIKFANWIFFDDTEG